jgi:ankyrin repeat protein
MKHTMLLCLVLTLALVTIGCKKEEPEPPQQASVEAKVQTTKPAEPVKATKPAKKPITTSAETESEKAETTIAAEPTVLEEDIDPDVALQRAAAAGDIEKIKSLLATGVDVNKRAKNGASLLHITLLQGHEAAAALLISKGADTHAMMTDGTTPLHFAVLRNCKIIAKFLLDDGVDVNALGTNLGSPLHIAANTGQMEIAEMLIEKGADVNIKNERGMTPLAFAKQKGSRAMLELLEKYGAE